MSLYPLNPIPAVYQNTGLINNYTSGASDFTTAQNGEGLRTTNNTTGGFLVFSSDGLITSPDGITISTLDPLNLSALANNPTPTELCINNNLIVQNADTSPTEIISIEAGINGGVGTFYGINYNSNTDQDFVIQTTNDNTGGVLFNQFGIGSTTTQTRVKQGVITCSNTANTNSITIDASNNNIVITDGTLTNTINKTGYSTINSTQNITHYLDFSDSSSTGVGAIQKTAGLSCNPFTNTITATTFVGDLSGNALRATNIAGGLGGSIPYQTAVNTTALLANGADGQFLKSRGTTLAPMWDTPTASTIGITNTETDANYYPTFVSGSGAGQTLRADITTTPFSFNPATGDLRRTTATITDDIAFSNTCINTATGSGSRRFSSSTLQSGNNNSAYPPRARISAQMDDMKYSECLVGGNDFELNTTQLYDEERRKAGIVSYRDGNDYPVSVLYADYTTFVPDVISISGVRVRADPQIIEMFVGSTTYSASANIATFFANGVVGSPGINFGQILGFTANSYGIQNNTTTTIISAGNPLSLTGGGLTFRNYNMTFSGTTNSITTYSYTSVPLNCIYTIIISNFGTGNTTFTGQPAGAGTTRVGGAGAGTNTFTIPAGRIAICELKYVNTNSFQMYFLNFTLM